MALHGARGPKPAIPLHEEHREKLGYGLWQTIIFGLWWHQPMTTPKVTNQ